MGSDAEIVLLKSARSHLVARGDMNQKIQMGPINDNAQARLKFFRRGHAVCGVDSAARKPFSPEREKTDANPGGVETGGGVGFEIERVRHEQ